MSPIDPQPLAAPFRAPTVEEEKTLLTLLSQPFPGRDALREQLRGVQVREVDANGSLQLQPTTGPRAEVSRRIAVEAESFDAEGENVHLLLHVFEGRMVELDIFREDGLVPQGRLAALRLLIL